MIKVTVLIVGTLVSSASLAGPFLDAPAAAVRASYTFGFGGSRGVAAYHSLALSSGPRQSDLQINAMEFRWAGKGSEFRVAGKPLTHSSLNAVEQTSGFLLNTTQNVILLAVLGAVAIGAVVQNSRESDNPNNAPSGTGSSN